MHQITIDLVARVSEACVGEYCLPKQEFRLPGPRWAGLSIESLDRSDGRGYLAVHHKHPV